MSRKFIDLSGQRFAFIQDLLPICIPKKVYDVMSGFVYQRKCMMYGQSGMQTEDLSVREFFDLSVRNVWNLTL